jgi:glycosyl transferase family 25
MQFGELGMLFEFFDGINGETATQALLHAIDEEAYLLNTGRLPSTGEIGCFASHRAVWEYCVTLNEPLIILEDDAMLLDNFPAAVNAVSALIERFGFIRLQHIRESPRVKVAEHNGLTLWYCKKYPHGAVAYAVSPEAAKKLLAGSRTVRAPTDKYIKNFWEHGQALYCLLTESVSPGVLNNDSTIAGRDAARTSLALRSKRALFKVNAAIQRALFNWRQQS